MVLNVVSSAVEEAFRLTSQDLMMVKKVSDVALSKAVHLVQERPLFVVSMLFLCFIAYKLWNFRARRLSHLPSRHTFHPFIGHLVRMIKTQDNPLENMLADARAMKHDSYISCCGFVPYIISDDPRTVEYILNTNFENFEKGETFRMLFDDMLGGGIFNSDGWKWKKQRRAASFMFSMRILKNNMSHVFIHHAHKLVNSMEAMLKSSSSKAVSMDMQKHFFNYTFDSICEIGFGVTERDEQFAQAFDKTQYLIEKRFTNPLFKMMRFFNVGPERVIRDNIKIMNDFSYRVIAERRAAQDHKDKPDLLSIFMHEMGKDGSEYDDVFLRDMIINFMIAGRDTTAVFLSWTFYMISQHPDMEKRILKEIEEHIGLDNDPSYDSVNGLNYLHAFMNETLRIYPPVPRDSKSAIKDDVLPNGTYVPAGINVSYSPYIFGHSEAIWGPDVEEFKPSRWFTESPDGKIVVKQVSQYLFPVFNAGPRLCLGKQVAYLEAKLLLVMLIRRFTFQLDESHGTVRYDTSITLPIRNGLHLIVRPRK